jgi:hypothetical protein
MRFLAAPRERDKKLHKVRTMRECTKMAVACGGELDQEMA